MESLISFFFQTDNLVIGLRWSTSLTDQVFSHWHEHAMIPFSESVLSCCYIFEILFLPFHQRIPWKRTMVDEMVLKAGKHYPWMISNQNLFAHVGLSVQLQVPRNLPHWNSVLSSSQIRAFRIITQCPSNSQFTLEKTSRIPGCQKLLFSFCYPYCIFFKCNCLSKTHSCFSLHLSPYHFFRNIKVWTLPWEAIEHSS